MVTTATISREAAAARTRRRLVILLRLLILIATIGGWEISARMGWIDPFFFSMPSAIAVRLFDWFTSGTAQGPIWLQIAVTLEEAMLGFLSGAAAGVELLADEVREILDDNRRETVETRARCYTEQLKLREFEFEKTL